MKKTVSALLIATFVFTGALTTLGQSKRTRPGGSAITDSVPAPSRPVNVVPIAPVEGETVRFGVIDAMSDGNGVLIRWQMQFETHNIGFNIYRLGGLQPVLVNDRVVLSTSVERGVPTVAESEYELFDPQGTLGTAYIIKSQELDWSSHDSTSFVPRSVRNIEAEAGRSRESLLATALHLNSDIESRGLELPEDLQAFVNSNLQEPNPEMQHWVASQPGVKISVNQDGLYRVSRQELLTAGFDVNSDSTKWQLFMNGNEQAIIVGDGDQYIEFLGKGLDTRETNTRIYYLIVAEAEGRRITSKVLRPVGGTVISKNYRATAKYEENDNFQPKVLNGEVDNYFGRSISQAPVLIEFNVTGMDTSVPRQVLEVNLLPTQGQIQHLRAVLNGHDLGHIGAASNVYRPFSEELLVPSEYFVEGTNVLSLNQTAQARNVLLDSVSVRYSRKFSADENSASFYTPGLRRVDVTGFTSTDFRLFDMTLDGSPVQISDLDIVPENGAFTLKLPSSRAMVMYAASDASILTSPSIVANIPSTLAASTNGADLVIISTPELMEASEVWANFRRSDAGGNFTVNVASVVDVLDEFSYGAHSGAGINTFLKHAVANWSIEPRYLLLMGDATWDPRNYEGFGFRDDLPTLMVSTGFEECGSDEALADLSVPHDGSADIAVGRIPAREATEVATVLTKTMAFETPLQQSLDRGALFVYDLQRDYDFFGMSLELASHLPPSMPKMFVGRGLPNEPTVPDPQAQANVINALNQGKYLVNFAGHGAAGLWGATNFFGNSQVPLLTNAGNESIFVMLTCLVGQFSRPNSDSLAETLLFAPNGGAVVAWGSTADTFPPFQLSMGGRFNEVVGEGEIKRMGDLVKEAKAAIAGSDVGYSWALLGDPMLQVRTDDAR